MAVLNVNPTRMELSRLKKSLEVALRGHKLLKDKRDELMRRFLEMMREEKKLRAEVEEKLVLSQKYLQSSAATMGEKDLKTALLLPKQTASPEVVENNFMSVRIPEFSYKMHGEENDIFSYGYAHTSCDLDRAVEIIFKLRDKIVRLASLEKSLALMAGEIERTRRRVNALEYVMIPNYHETIRYIIMKLDESERSNSIRLLKVKDMIILEKIEK
ncbi:MAG: V-type ATP synthase subunit D [Firmicutes bacterium]|nr:V-type ATP synthase subunit D [Bacillota bacterium]